MQHAANVTEPLPGRRVLRAMAVVAAVALGLPAVAWLVRWATGSGTALILPLLALAGGAICATLVVRPLDRPFARLEGVLVGAVGVGAVAFELGFTGPLLLSSSNLGPLLGFLTGPVGLVVGALVGYALTDE